MRPKSTTRAPSDHRADDSLRLRLVLEPPHSMELPPIPLAPGRTCLGSGPDCEVRLNVRGIAERHCLIVAGPARTVVKALSPLTWINDGAARETPLRSGDRLAIGPLEFRVREPFPSELPAFETAAPDKSQPRSHAADPLWNEAFARRELVQAAAAARSEMAQRTAWTSPLSGVGFDEAAAVSRVSPPDHSAEQREYLARLAETLTAREVELTAREADLRCRWEELQLERAACQAAERAVRSQRQELTRREADHDAGRAQLDSERTSLNTQIAELETRQRELAAEAVALQAERDRLQQWDERLQQHESALHEREQFVGTEQARLKAEQERITRLTAELDAQAEALREERSAVESARSAWIDEQRERAEAGVETARQDSLLSERQQSLEQREQDLALAQAALESAQAAAQAAQQRFDDDQAELERRSAEQERERLELNAARDAVLAARTDLDAIRAECDVRQAALDRLAEDLADRERAAVLSAAAAEFDAHSVAACDVLPDQNTPTADEPGGPDDLAFQREQVAAEHERLSIEREQFIAEQSRLEAERQELFALRQSLDVEQLQSEWAQLSQARRELEDERALFHRQLQEFAASTSVKAVQDDQLAATDAGPVEGSIADVPPPCEAVRFESALDAAPEGIASEEIPGWSPSVHDELSIEEHDAPSSLPVHWETLHAELTSQADVGEESWISETPAAVPDGDADAFSYADHADADDDRPPPAWRPSEAPGGDAEVPAETDPLLSLRSRLAELFGISSFGQPTPESHGGSESVEADGSDVESHDGGGDAPAEGLTAELNDGPEFEVVEEAAEEPAAAEPESKSSLTAAVAAMPAPEGEGDSISSYMERLIARSRKPGGNARDSAEAEIRTVAPAATVVDTVETESASAVEERPVQSKNLTAPDKELLRANLDSFRELANISARSAVAKHESKKLHSVVQYKLIMLAMSVGLCLALWAANLMNRGSYVPYAVAAGIASLVMAAEVGRTLLAFYRWKSVEAIGQWEDDEDEPTAAAETQTESPADDEQAVSSGS